ncbi:sirohydrochlorin chelatase [Brevibacillus laterosporus]
MNGILFIGHGSRDAEGNEHLLQFTQRVTELLKEQTEVTLYETCFLELTRPTIMQQGCKK